MSPVVVDRRRLHLTPALARDSLRSFHQRAVVVANRMGQGGDTAVRLCTSGNEREKKTWAAFVFLVPGCLAAAATYLPTYILYIVQIGRRPSSSPQGCLHV